MATGRFAGEGFDDSRLDTLFLALPVSWRGTLTQYAGRLHRHLPKRPTCGSTTTSTPVFRCWKGCSENGYVGTARWATRLPRGTRLQRRDEHRRQGVRGTSRPAHAVPVAWTRSRIPGRRPRHRARGMSCSLCAPSPSRGLGHPPAVGEHDGVRELVPQVPLLGHLERLPGQGLHDAESLGGSADTRFASP